MPELKMLSPLLNGMTVEREAGEHNGRACFILRNAASERFVLKRMSVPASDMLIRALILSGAYPTEAAVHDYYTHVVTDIRRELDKGRELAEGGCYAGALGYQIDAHDDGIGYDVYILYPLYVSLADFLSNSDISHLRAINLGIDLCDALVDCRAAGYIFANLKPENVLLMPTGKFLLGDLGLAAVEDLRYTCIPEEYIGPYSAPELSDLSLSPNTTVDLYSLGMLLYRIYNGNQPPFVDENTGEAMADKLRMTGKPLPTPIYADYELAGIILKACAFHKEDRYQTPDELKQALTLYMQRNEISDAPVVPPIVVPEMPPIDPQADEEESVDEPMRMTEADELDDDFRQSFSPDLTGCGTEADIDPNAVPTPAVQPPVAQALVGEAPAEDAPIEDASDEDTPVAEAPIEDAPVENTPAEDASGENAPVENAPVEDAPVEDTPVAEAPVEDAPVEPTPTEDVDPDQMDLDELLASVSRIVDGAASEGTSAEPPVEESATEDQTAEPQDNDGLTLTVTPADDTHAYVDSESHDENPYDLPSTHSRGLSIAVIVALLAAIGAVVWFLVSWYFVDATQLNAVSCSIDQLVVELISDDDASRFVLTCTDSYGNAYPGIRSGDRYTFTGLSERTSYTITVSAAQYHKLRNADAYTISITTPEATAVSDLCAVRGDKDGEVQLTFSYEGPAPSQWQVTCTDADGSVVASYPFVGSTYVVTGLQPNEVYTFTLTAEEGIYLTGETSTQYEILPIVEGKNLHIAAISGNRVTLTWEQGENSPAQWVIVCEADGMDRIIQKSTECSCEITLPDFSREYTFTLMANGMDLRPTLTLPANPIIIDSLGVVINEDGSATVSWTSPAGIPSGGWYVAYNTIGSLHAAYMPGASGGSVTGNSVTLQNLVPGTAYEVSLSLTAADASSTLFGQTTLVFNTPAAESFSAYDITPTPPYANGSSFVSLWIEPTNEDWTYYDLNDHREVFSAQDHIAVCIEVNAVNQSDDTVTLLYAVRDADGNVVNDVSAELAWDNLWYNRRHVNAIPLPASTGEDSVPGSYTLEVYVNGKLLASAGFTIT